MNSDSSWSFNTTNAIQKFNESPHKHRGTALVDLHSLGRKRKTQLFDQTNGLEVASGGALVIAFDGRN